MKKPGVLLLLSSLALLNCTEAERPKALTQVELNSRMQAKQSMLITEIPPSQQARVPNLRSATLNGGVFDLADHLGKVVVLNFWGTWCAPCIAEMPEFIKLQEEYGTERLMIVGVSTPNEPADQVYTFIEELGVNYPIIYDTDNALAERFSPPAWPTTYLIGTDGAVKAFIIGGTNETLLSPVLDKLLSEI